MKKIAINLAVTATLLANAQSIKTNIDLTNVKDDKIAVTISLPQMKSQNVKFHFPKTVPGTYSVDDYGRFVEGIKFFDHKGNELNFTKIDSNTYALKNAKNLSKISYFVNDSFDEEMNESAHKAVFSPSGTTIEDGKVFLLNTHGFVGYISDMQDVPYQLIIQKPTEFQGITALVDQDQSEVTDTYTLANYSKLTDSPLMYSKPNQVTFNAGGMEVVVGIYSPTGKYKASDFKDDLEKMIIAQKKFLGDMNVNKKYAILLYLADFTGSNPKIKGFGALEHHESTTVVLPEMMPKEMIAKTLTDVVAHEFFHTVNPLKTHSEEIHYFDYANPKMSQHLWMYEGGTEYFANLFQIQEGLIDKDEFLKRINEKINNSQKYKDTLPFTEMSKNVLQDQYKDEYANVYEKGTLLAMSLDIELRRLSDGKIGYRDMIRKLAQRFGENKPFKDEELINELVTITGYPEVKEFYHKYISGNNPTPYAEYLKLVGIEKSNDAVSILRFASESDQIGFNPVTKTLNFGENPTLTTFSKNIGFQANDEILAVDGKMIELKDIENFIIYLTTIKEGQEVAVTVLRQNGDKKDKIELKGKAVLDAVTKLSYQYKKDATPAEIKLQNHWLSGK
jgi:predicted metalloprotease with PDZ domain